MHKFYFVVAFLNVINVLQIEVGLRNGMELPAVENLAIMGYVLMLRKATRSD